MNKERIAFFRKEVARGRGVNNYVVVFPQKLFCAIPAPCFNELKDLHTGGAIAFIDYPFAHCPRFTPNIKKYLYWLFNKSAWRNAFLSKDIARKGIVYNTSYPAQFVIQAAILTRYPSEWEDIIYFWNKLQEYVDEHLALLVAHLLEKEENNCFIFIDNRNSNHYGLNPGLIGVEEIKKMINNEPHIRGFKPFSTNTNYKDLNTIWNTKNIFRSPPRFPLADNKHTKIIYGREIKKACFSLKKRNLQKTVAAFLSLNSIEEMGK